MENNSKVLTLTVKNGTNKRQQVSLFNILTNLHKPNYGLPQGVTFDIDKTDYGRLLLYINPSNILAKIRRCTNPRQLDFTTTSILGVTRPLMPHLTKQGYHRPQVYVAAVDGYEYKTPWDPKKWNIADSGEGFMLNVGLCIMLDLKRAQTFTISMDIIDPAKVNGEPHMFKTSKALS